MRTLALLVILGVTYAHAVVITAACAAGAPELGMKIALIIALIDVTAISALFTQN